MKKSLFIIALLCASVTMFAEENTQENKQDSIKGYHPYKLEENKKFQEGLAHWSIMPRIGFNVFDGDFDSEMKHGVSFPSVGLGVEYSFTPAWAIGLEYTFDMYQVTGKNVASHQHADKLLKGYMHKADLYLSVDLINLFFPRAKRKIFNMQPLIGAGYMWYRNSTMYADSTRFHTADFEPASMDKYKGVFFIKAGVNFEFNLNRSLALGVRATYDYAMNDYVDNRGFATEAALASKNNDGIFDFTIGLRWKIEPIKDTHVRNISSLETVEKMQEKPIHDTVIIHRHDSIIVRERVERVERVEETQDQYYYVYFDNNVSDLDDKGLVTIQQVADRLNEDEDLYAVVTGFCDNTGSSSLNYILGDKRAANVIEELRYEYGVANNHLYAMGMGKVAGRGKQAAAYAPNRRAQIRLVDKETFERLKQNLDEKKEMRVVDTQTIPLSESARKAQINTYKSRKHEKVTVEKGTTLTKLAKQYYDNIYCWVYLYMANIDRIENPNALIEGSVLEIPELTKEELAITKEESLVLYGMSHQFK